MELTPGGVGAEDGETAVPVCFPGRDHGGGWDRGIELGKSQKSANMILVRLHRL